MSNVIVSVADNYTSLTNHRNKQYIYFFLTEREKETEYLKKDWICVLRSMDILPGKIIHHGNDSIAWNNKVDISINKVGYAFLTNQNKMKYLT